MSTERPFTPAVAVAWTLLTTLVVLAGTRAFVSVRASAATDLVQFGALEALSYTLGCFAVLRVHAPDRRGRDAFALRPTHPAMLLFGVALGFVLHAPTETLERLIERYHPLSELEKIQEAAMFSPETRARAILLVLTVTCVVPLVEELFFRGVLYTCLRRRSSALAAGGITAVCFALSHLESRVWLPVLLVSLAVTHLRVQSGSVLPCLALHVSFNAVSLAAVFTGAVSVSDPLPLPPIASAAGWLLCAGLVLSVEYLARRSSEASRARTEDADES
jgi:membrane protease YdiL (CAAX protease family)